MEKEIMYEVISPIHLNEEPSLPVCILFLF